MATFTIASTKQGQFWDANVLPKRPGMDYAGRASAAWQEIRDNLDALDAVDEQLVRTHERWMAGQRWLDSNRDHERYMEGYQTANELENEKRNLIINAKSIQRVIWSHCLTLYGCLYHIDRQQWQQQSGVEWDATSPSAIWQAVCPGREQPGEYPAQKREAWLERRMNYKAWSLHEDES